jgi:hypothetical protein
MPLKTAVGSMRLSITYENQNLFKQIRALSSILGEEKASKG